MSQAVTTTPSDAAQAAPEATEAATEAATDNLAARIAAGADQAALAAYLDGLDPEARITEARSLSGKLLAALWERCAGSLLTLEDMVPRNAPVGEQVIFAGRNDLLMFRLFEKRFARTKDGAIIGYNHQTMRPFTGPGYFTVLPAGDEIVIDYTTEPTQDDAPADWPKVKPNASGLSHFIYKDMQDYCRRVSRDVVIGHATKFGKSIGHYFVLARRPAPPAAASASENPG